MSVSSMGVVRVQGMCPHEIYLGTCTCIKVLKKYTAYMYSRMKNFLSFLGQKKIGQGVLRERDLGTYTSPTLMI